MELRWSLKSFESLSSHELYAIIRLRNEVFVVEQNCVFQDADNKDQPSLHLMGHDSNGKLLAYCRIVPPGISYTEPSIGRVVSDASVRRQGAGKLLMQEALQCCSVLYPKQPVRIGAQLYLKQFYNAFGFHQTGEVYLEDGIEHIEMCYTP